MSATYDLQTFLRRTSVSRSAMASLAFPEQRNTATEGVVLVEDPGAIRVTEKPVHVHAYVDGIQSQMVLAYRDHRPVVLTYVAAGAAGRVGKSFELVDLAERLSVVCSSDDVEWLDSLNTEPAIPVASVPAAAPPVLAADILERVQQMRAHAEVVLRARVLDSVDNEAFLVVDGSLQGAENDPRMGGVVKTVRTQYLPDEGTLYGLPAGYRSAMFKLPGRAGTPDRYSAYLRLHSAATREWSFGLIRVEAFIPEAIGPLCARALAETQGPHSGDGRWDRHLKPVAETERLLRARRPLAFGLATA